MSHAEFMERRVLELPGLPPHGYDRFLRLRLPRNLCHRAGRLRAGPHLRGLERPCVAVEIRLDRLRVDLRNRREQHCSE
jgi:hypothetical protein